MVDDGFKGNLSVLVEDKQGRRFVAIVKEWVPLDAKDIGAQCEPSKLLEVTKHDGRRLFYPAPVLGRGDFTAGFPTGSKHMKEKCRDCKFWQSRSVNLDRWSVRENNNGRLADCRKHSPIKSTSPDSVLGDWPQTFPEDGCGDFQQFLGPQGA